MTMIFVFLGRYPSESGQDELMDLNQCYKDISSEKEEEEGGTTEELLFSSEIRDVDFVENASLINNGREGRRTIECIFLEVLRSRQKELLDWLVGNKVPEELYCNCAVCK